MKTTYRALISIAIAGVVAAGISTRALAADSTSAPTSGFAVLSSSRSPLMALDGAVDWVNSKPLTATDLRGKVVLINFWAYSCINSHRMLPYIGAWANKYKDQGLVVINVQTPEFGFEHDAANVRQSVMDLKLQTPVVLDGDYKIWRAFNNDVWPALYFVDAKGVVRHQQLGEGNYDQSERVLQQLLKEAGAKNVDTGFAHVVGVGSQAEADWRDLRSPETYIGSDRTEGFASPGGLASGRTQNYAAPAQLPVNQWALAGTWSITGESATLIQEGGKLVYRFHARDLHVVMGLVKEGKPVPFRVRIDGQPPGASHGTDVDEQGWGTLGTTRLYQLIRQQGPVRDRLFEIEFQAPGVQVYSFTFG